MKINTVCNLVKWTVPWLVGAWKRKGGSGEDILAMILGTKYQGVRGFIQWGWNPLSVQRTIRMFFGQDADTNPAASQDSEKGKDSGQAEAHKLNRGPGIRGFAEQTGRSKWT